MHCPGLNFADVAIVIRVESAGRERDHQPGTPSRDINRRAWDKNDSVSQIGQAFEHWLVLGLFCLGWIRPEGKIEASSPIPVQILELIQTRTAHTRDSVFLALGPKIVRLAADEKNSGRGKFARDHAHKIRPERREKTGLHGSTL